MTKIEWCDETLNPQGWGCFGPGGTPEHPKICSYCYAKRMASRMMRTCELCNQFIPHYHSEVMAKVREWKKPRKIFWQSMGDLFHPHTPDWLIQEVLYTVKNDLRHTHIFLTKNPKRLKDFNPWPSNCWVGCTVTNQADADGRLPWLLQVDAAVRFVSHEPLLGNIDVAPYLPPKYCPNCKNTGYPWIECGNEHSGHDFRIECECKTQSYLDWAIIGAQTGPGAVKPEPSWVVKLEYQYQMADVPIFEKENLRPLYAPGAELVQKWPAAILEGL